MLNRVHSQAARFWLLQAFGWSAFGVGSLLGTLPYRESHAAIIYRGALIVSGFLASLPLWQICRRVWKLNLSWPQQMAIAVVSSYALGFLCVLTAIGAEKALLPMMKDSWEPPLLLAAFGGSVSASFVLIAWSGIYFGVKQWEDGHRREERLLNAEALAREAELRALRYQLTPHFLFNTLNGISTLVGEGETQDARKMIALLSAFLRTTFESAGNADVTLRHEMEHMQQYLAIEQTRLGARLQASFNIDCTVEDALMPNLLLQPLIENAIRHGIAPFASGGEVRVAAQRRADEVQVSIVNRVFNSNGAPVNGSQTASGVGLANVKGRLQARYGTMQRFRIEQEGHANWEVTLSFPYEAGSECPE